MLLQVLLALAASAQARAQQQAGGGGRQGEALLPWRPGAVRQRQTQVATQKTVLGAAQQQQTQAAAQQTVLGAVQQQQQATLQQPAAQAGQAAVQRQQQQGALQQAGQAARPGGLQQAADQAGGAGGQQQQERLQRGSKLEYRDPHASWYEVPEFNLTREEALTRSEVIGHPVLVPNVTGTNIPMRQSSVECIGTTFEHRVCTFYDLVLWNGTMFYVSDENVTLPDVQMTYIAVEPFRLHTNLSASLNVTSPAKLARLIKRGNFTWADIPKVAINDSLFFYVSYHDNYGHLLGEMGPMVHDMLCTHFRRCGPPAPGQPAVQLLLYNPQPNVTHIMPRAIRDELWPCFSPHPLLRLNDGRLNHTAVVLRRMVAGIGATCRGFPWCRPRYGRHPITRFTARSWKTRLAQCFDPLGSAAAPQSTAAAQRGPQNAVALPRANDTRPTLVVVNRPAEHGRSFLNADEIQAKLQAQFSNLTVKVVELEEGSMRDQAASYAGADILVQMHGAALGNVVFLPLGAVYIDVVPENNEDKHAWAFFMLKDYEALYINPIALPPQKVQLMEGIITRFPHWSNMTEEQRRAVLEDHVCPRPGAVPFNEYQVCVIEWFMKRSNAVLNYTQLAASVSHAQEHLSVWAHRLLPSYYARHLDLGDGRVDLDMLDLI